MRAAALALLAPLLVGASEPRLVPDVSQTQVDIAYSFTGAELLLFGAVLYPGGRAAAPGTEVAVVVKGPSEPLLVREKAKVAGVWVNHASERFRSVPSFYAVASSRPLDRLVSQRTAAIYELGIDNLLLSPANGAGAAEQARFEAGLVEMKRRAGLYAEHVGSVTIREGVLYRATVPIPARVPVGSYTAETFLIRDGRVVAAATRDIVIDKSGFERFVATSADRDPLAYGLVAVALSLLLGWAAAIGFARR
ncbi:TIGR02186 family protein [Sphingomonas nostoxanthinifaciens]|uniref:TIGR02186 family protein n=1 Tax=Sphingomonas nostoxanthinifaciens TaxID=2872652 RepID=UPI001CC1CFD8|nr:TIGR02186 family protein [Sphingomonas nostoxanthinifaciens]UAK24587.1 TIGR02186 family protein [Sphingomonas nostoxanthinifaciens]